MIWSRFEWGSVVVKCVGRLWSVLVWGWSGRYSGVGCQGGMEGCKRAG